jgi:hypothetical protein
MKLPGRHDEITHSTKDRTLSFNSGEELELAMNRANTARAFINGLSQKFDAVVIFIV